MHSLDLRIAMRIFMWYALLAFVLFGSSSVAYAQEDCLHTAYCSSDRTLPSGPEGAASPQVNAAGGSQHGHNWHAATFSRSVSMVWANTNWEILTGYGDFTDRYIVASSPGNDINPRLSPGAKRIVFASDRATLHLPKEQRIYSLYSVNPDGSDLRRLTDLPVSQWDPVWSPDGARILFDMEIDGNSDLYTVNADGTGLTRITTNLLPDMQATWSRTTNEIAWARRTSETTATLLIANADGSHERPLLADYPYLEYPVFAPGGDRIAFSAAPNPSYGSSNQFMVLSTATGSQPIGLQECQKNMWCRVAGWSEAVPPAFFGDRDEPWKRRLEDAYTLFGNFYTYSSRDRSKVDNVGFGVYFGWGSDHSFPEITQWEAGQSGVSSETVRPSISLGAIPDALRLNFEFPHSTSDLGPAGIVFKELEFYTNGATPAFVYREVRGSIETFVLTKYDPGVELKVRARAIDFAGNISPYTAWVPFITYDVRGQLVVTDNRGVPLEGANATPINRVLRVPLSNQSGEIDYLVIEPTEAEPPVPHFTQVAARSAGSVIPNDFVPFYQAMPQPENGEAVYDRYFTRTYIAPAAVNPVKDGDFEGSNANGSSSTWLLTNAQAWKNGYAPAQGYTLWLNPQGPAQGWQSLEASATQVIDAEKWANMPNPTLSFLYVIADFHESYPGGKIKGYPGEPGSVFEAAVTDMATFSRTVVFSDTIEDAIPRVGWANLTPWQGKAIRIEFWKRGAIGYPGPQSTVVMDRVKIAPWTTPVITAISPVTETLGVQTTMPTVYRLTVTNLLGIPRITVGGFDVSATKVDEVTLQVNTKGVSPGNHRVCTIHDSGMYSCASESILVGNIVWLPLVQ